MNHQDKFWQAFRDKVEDYSPSEYSAAEWSAMEQMLDGGGTSATDTVIVANATKPWWAFWQLWVGVLLLSGLAFWALATTNLNFTTAKSETTLSTSATNNELSSSATALESTLSTEESPAEASVAAGELPSSLTTEDTAEDAVITEEPLSDSAPLSAQFSTTAPDLVQEVAPSSAQSANASSQAPTEQSNELASFSNGKELPPVRPMETADLEQSEATTTMAEPVQANTAVDEIVEAEQENATVEDRLDQGSVAALATLELQPISTEEALPVTYQTAPEVYASRWRSSLLFGASTTLTNTGDGTPAYGPVVGLGLERTLNQRWSVELEVLARLVTNYDLTLSASDTFVNLAGQLRWHNESNTLQEYLSLDIPLVLRYRTNQRWTLSGGLRYSLLSPTATAGRMQFTQQSEAVLSRVRQPLILQNDFGLLFGVEYAINPRWSLRLRYSQSFVDLSPDNLYESTDTHLNSDLQITARKKF